MEYATILLTLAGMHILMAMIPGPNTVIVSWFSATRSRRDGLTAVAGVVFATLVWVSFALWGVGALLMETGWLYRMLRLAGAAYLVFTGVRMLRAGFASDRAQAPRVPKTAGNAPFRTGFMTTISNPKSAVFWTSAFLVAVPHTAPAWFFAAILAIIAMQSLLWYGFVALFFSTGIARSQYMRFSKRLDLLAGTVMVALGLKLADEVRRELAVQVAS